MDYNNLDDLTPQVRQAINDERFFKLGLEPDFLQALPLFQSESNHSVQVLWSCWNNVKYLQERNIPGDFVEFGVWRGGTLAACLASATLFSTCTDRDIKGFDTFEGYPKPRDDEFDIHGNSMLERWYRLQSGIPWGSVDIGTVQRFLDKISLSPKANLIKRNISEDFDPKFYGLERIAFLRLDMNWYHPTKVVLSECWPLLVNGGILQIVTGHHSGAKRAFDEFMAAISSAPPPPGKRFNKENLFMQRVNYSTLNILKLP